MSEEGWYVVYTHSQQERVGEWEVQSYIPRTPDTRGRCGVGSISSVQARLEREVKRSAFRCFFWSTERERTGIYVVRTRNSPTCSPCAVHTVYALFALGAHVHVCIWYGHSWIFQIRKMKERSFTKSKASRSHTDELVLHKTRGMSFTSLRTGRFRNEELLVRKTSHGSSFYFIKFLSLVLFKTPWSRHGHCQKRLSWEMLTKLPKRLEWRDVCMNVILIKHARVHNT